MSDKFVTANLQPLFEGIVNTFICSPECHGLLKHLVGAEFERFRPEEFVIVRADGQRKLAEKMRPEVKDILQMWELGIHPFVVGPAGCGKTTLMRHAAELLDRPLSYLSCSPDYGQSTYFGRNQPVKDGRWEFIQGVVTRAAREGHVLFFDEIDNGDASSHLVLNSLLDKSGSLSVPNWLEHPTVEINPDFRFVCAANTVGRGSDRMYVGRNQLDEAFLDRFAGGVMYIDYDNRLEGRIARSYKQHGRKILQFHRKLRKKTRELQMRRVVSTRMLESACKWAELPDFGPVKAIERMLAGWTEDEKIKLEIAEMTTKHLAEPQPEPEPEE